MTDKRRAALAQGEPAAKPPNAALTSGEAVAVEGTVMQKKG